MTITRLNGCLMPIFRFDIDVAAPVGGIPWIPASVALAKPMMVYTRLGPGLVWMNPPFSNAEAVGR
jgi:hypothetical protein